MVTKEEYKKAFNILENDISSSFKYSVSPSYKALTGIKLTLENAVSMNSREWEIWYSTYKNDYEVLCAGLSTECVPKSIVNSIINNLDMIKKHSYDRNKWSDEKTKDIAIIKEALKNEISKSSFDKIIYEVGNDIFSFLGFTDGSIDNTHTHLSDDTLNFLALESIKSFATETFYSPFHTFGPEAVQYVRDEKFLKKVMSNKNMSSPVELTEGQKEKIRSKVVDNVYMSDAFRNEMFRDGCDWSILVANKYTSEIIEEGYLGAIDTFSEVYDFDKKETKSGFGLEYQTCMMLLTRLVETGQLPEHFEIDLANRLIQRGERSSDILTDAFLCNTYNVDVLNLVKGFKNQDQLNIYSNPNVPEALLKDRINELFQKVVKDLDKGRKVASSWLEQIGEYSHKTQLTNEQYRFLFSLTPKSEMIMDFILSYKTPTNILKDFLNESYKSLNEIIYSGGVPVSIETVLFMKENTYPKEFVDAIKEYLKKETLCNYVDDETKQKLSLQIKENPELTTKLLEFYHKKIKEPAPNREWDSKKDIDMYKSLSYVISKEFDYHKQKNIYKATGDIKQMSDDNVYRLWQEIRQNFATDKLKVHNGCLLLEQYAKDINVVYDENNLRQKAIAEKMHNTEEIEELY